ncbi:hypothetical protein OROGR_010889 [Orobanche gracilis]
MKFVGWTQRKLMHNGMEPNRNSTIGNLPARFSVQALFDEQSYHKEPTKTRTCSNIMFQKSSNRFEANKGEVIFQEESLEPFDFLTIGTFGIELLKTDPPTPTLPTALKSWANPQTEITENDLKLINYELEKFLEAEVKEFANDTSRRSSQTSITTLSHKPSYETDSEGHVYTMTYPLQNYLFATSIEQTGTDVEVKKEKTSLEGLFKESNIAHDDPTKICEEAEQEPRKREVADFMKKVVKKFHSSSSCSKASSKNAAALSTSIKKKLSKCNSKAIKMFHRKVHPEGMTEKQSAKLQKGEKKDISHEYACQIRGLEENEMDSQCGSKKTENSIRKLSSNGTYRDASTINGEHWIKTDSDCKFGIGAVREDLEAKEAAPFCSAVEMEFA